MKQLLSLILLAVLPMAASAYDAGIGGIYYNFSNGEATVTYKGDNGATANSYSGDVVIPETVTFEGVVYKVTCIGGYAFYNCKELTSVIIPDGVTSIGDAEGGYTFYKCTSLTRIDIPYTVTSLGDGTFYNCSALADIYCYADEIPSTGNYVFYGLPADATLHVPVSDYKNAEPWSGFANIEYLSEIDIDGLTFFFSGNNAVLSGSKPAYENFECVIPESVIYDDKIYPVTHIGKYAFYLKYMTSVSIPSSMTSIGMTAFMNCKGLTKVYCYAEQVPETASSAFPSSMRNAVLYVPASSIESYKETSPWSRFGTIIALEAMTCAKPTISYAGGELAFNCETEGVTFHSSITDADINSYEGDKVQLSVTYNISVYATKEGYLRSIMATATLCWIEAKPVSEGLTDEDAVTEVKALPVLIQSQGGTISIQGAPEGTQVAIYGTDGKEYGSAISVGGGTTIATSLKPGSIAVVKIGEKAVKVTIK